MFLYGFKFWNDFYAKNWNNYETLSKVRSLPFGLGGIAGSRADQLLYEENKRYWSDYSKNTGIKLGNNKYPIRSGYYAGSNFGGGYMSTLNQFMNPGIKALYKR